MKTNVHPIERWARVVLGVIIMSFAFWGPTNYWYLLGLISVATGFIGWCPIYSMFGISTCKTGEGPRGGAFTVSSKRT
jgi:hypothetical protein